MTSASRRRDLSEPANSRIVLTILAAVASARHFSCRSPVSSADARLIISPLCPGELCANPTLRCLSATSRVCHRPAPAHVGVIRVADRTGCARTAARCPQGRGRSECAPDGRMSLRAINGNHQRAEPSTSSCCDGRTAVTLTDHSGGQLAPSHIPVRRPTRAIDAQGLWRVGRLRAMDPKRAVRLSGLSGSAPDSRDDRWHRCRCRSAPLQRSNLRQIAALRF
jgi:hypothetical protein